MSEVNRDKFVDTDASRFFVPKLGDKEGYQCNDADNDDTKKKSSKTDCASDNKTIKR